MSQSAAIEAAQNFLNTVWNGNPPSDAELSAALDTLFMAYHGVQPTEVPFADLDPPRQEWEIVNAEVAKRFPDYGFYSNCDPLEVYDPPMMLADAIDDIADITQDMRSTVWIGEHIGLERADSFYRGFYFHWGRHARELSTYLHARQFR